MTDPAFNYSKYGWTTVSDLKRGETQEVDVGHYYVTLWWTDGNTSKHYTVTIRDERTKNTVHQWRNLRTIKDARHRFMKATRRAAKLLALDALGVAA